MAAAKTPWWMQALWPKRLWRMPANATQPTLYLTFDDGPTPGVTDWLLDLLDAYQAKATFFVVGQQAEKHPDLLREVYRRGHTVGTHTYNHLNGWKTPSSTYLANVAQGNQVVSDILTEEFPDYQPFYFRPPYGRIRSRDARKITDQKLVMWNTLASDWRKDLSVDQVTARVVDHADNGSIAVMHDSLKAEANMKGAMQKILPHFAEAGFVFAAL